jgi:hypothetical protein
MSMSHKAFEISWSEFERELLPVLTRALGSGETRELELFVENNSGSCSDPNDGLPIGENWVDALGDLQALGDIALTKYYSPAEDFGLGEEWSSIDSEIPKTARVALLGNALKSGNVAFDPGLMGSYFQSPGQVVASLESLVGIERPSLYCFVDLLNRAKANGNGVYNCF